MFASSQVESSTRFVTTQATDANSAKAIAVPAKQDQVTRRVLVHGLVYFGRVFAEFMTGDGWEFRYYPDEGLRSLAGMLRELATCDLVYQLGGRVTQGKFLRVAHALGKKHMVMHWMGSDVLDEQSAVRAGKTNPWVLQHLHHWAESDWMVREVRALGSPCELVPFPSALIPEEPSALPEDRQPVPHKRKPPCLNWT